MDFSPPPPSSSSSNFPILAVAIIGILATAFLLVSYYIFVINCNTVNWHGFAISRREDPSPANLPTVTPQGLEDSLIRLIPVIRFRKESDEETEYLECSVCLSEFRQGEKLRVIPNCCHAFHIDCIDVWLQTNANCPLCRSTISSTTLSMIHRIPNCSDVVIEIQDTRLKLEQGNLNKKNDGSILDLSSVDDKCINTDDVFHGAQPIRRSISMDLSRNAQLCFDIPEQSMKTEITRSNSDEGCSTLKRSFFSFGNGRG